MKPFNEFRNKDASFWAFIKFISETMGYTDRRCSTVKSYSEKEIRGLCQKHNINISDDTLSDALTYTQMRANLLNDFAEPMLMDAIVLVKNTRNGSNCIVSGIIIASYR